MAAEAVAESEPGFRQRVWVLCGGEGTQADLSLASGLHTYYELRKQPDLQVRSSTSVPEHSSHTMQRHWLIGHSKWPWCLRCACVVPLVSQTDNW